MPRTSGCWRVPRSRSGSGCRIPSAFSYVSIDVGPDGSLLALERKYDMQHGQDRLVRVDDEAVVLNSFPLDFMPSRVVVNRWFWDVWVIGSEVLRFRKASFSSNSVPPERYGVGSATYADVARDGSLWIGAQNGLLHLARDGSVLGQLEGFVAQKMCIAVVEP